MQPDDILSIGKIDDLFSRDLGQATQKQKMSMLAGHPIAAPTIRLSGVSYEGSVWYIPCVKNTVCSSMFPHDPASR